MWPRQDDALFCVLVLWISVLRRLLRIALSLLAGQFFGMFAFVMARNIRPELDDFGAHDPIGSDGQTIFDRIADRALRGWVIDIGDSRANQVAGDIGVIRPKSAFVAFAPHGTRCRPQG